MTDLQSVDFALMPGLVRKKNQFRQPDDFSELDFTIPSQPGQAIHCPGFQLFLEFSQHGQTAVQFYTTRVKQEISTIPLSEAEIDAYQQL